MADRALAGRTAVVTGSNSGIGLGIAEGLAGAGADLVMLCSRQPALAAQAQVATTALPDDGVEAAIPQPEVQGIPSREAVRDRLFNAKINTAAEGLLADLRADAIIRRP